MRLSRPTASVLLAGVMLLSACSAGGGEYSTEPGGNAFELTIGSAVPAKTLVATKAIEDVFIPEVQQRVAAETKYTIEFTALFGTVVGVGEELDGIAQRQLDMGTSIFPYDASSLPLHNLGYYVPFSSPDLRQTIGAFRQVYEGNDKFAEVYRKHNQLPLMFFGIGDYGVVTDFSWQRVEELRGHRIAGVGANLEWIKPVGATPVQAPAGEWYTSLQTGVFEGGITFTEGIPALRLHEVADHFTEMRFGSVPVGALTVNLDAWNELPEEVRNVISDFAREFEGQASELVNNAADDARDSLDQLGMTVTVADKQTREEWASRLADLPRNRGAELDAAGLPGSELLAAYIEAQREQGHVFPVSYDLSGRR